ncbi:hypothetical protein [Clostridium butyricum]|uniref:hypothetical protein n=2 Tax=Clostridium butyricum TaxID=1492 RepID=UPI002AB291A1|nr:hypothetical protein [Clostridium butyricum]
MVKKLDINAEHADIVQKRKGNIMDNVFKNMTKEELKSFFNDCGVEVEITDEGKGGLFVEGKQISVEDFINDIKNDL